MKNISKMIVAIIALLTTMAMSSCGTIQPTTLIVPTALSSVSRVVNMKDLNLTKDNYQIINTETAEAVVYYEEDHSGNIFEINELNDEYALEFKKKDTGGYSIKYSGIVKCGYLSSDDNGIDYDRPVPAAFARGLAAYRLINAVQDQGADGIIEPIITVKVGQDGRRVIYTATISAKLVKIKTK